MMSRYRMNGLVREIHQQMSLTLGPCSVCKYPVFLSITPPSCPLLQPLQLLATTPTFAKDKNKNSTSKFTKSSVY